VADGVFGVEVVTPEQSLVAGGATSVVLATSEGSLTVLDGPHPWWATWCRARSRWNSRRHELRLAVHGGFLQVDTSPGAAEGLAEGDGDRCPASRPKGDRCWPGGRRAGGRDRRAPGRTGPPGGPRGILGLLSIQVIHVS
jgi:hypothetical protein